MKLSGEHRRILMQRLAFVAYAFSPGVLMFFLPLLFYRIPLIVHLYDRVTTVSGRYVVEAAAISFTWFALAGGIVLWPSKTELPAARVWDPRAAWNVFLVLSTAGSAVSLLHSFFRESLRVEEVVHQIAFTPVLGIVLGIWLLREVRRGTIPAARIPLIYLLLLTDGVVALVVPLLLSKAAPTATGVVAILYGSTLIGALRRRHVLRLALLVLLAIFVALPLREFLRESVYGLRAYQRHTLSGQDAPGRGGAAGRAQLNRLVDDILAGGRVLVHKASSFDPAVDGLWLPRVGGVAGILEFGVAETLDRLNRLSDLAYVVQMTPARLPYAGGVTYYPLVGVLIPRALWTEKPEDSSGTFYALRYEFLHPDAVAHQTYNLSIPAEGWLNAGGWGVVASSVFLAVVLRFIWQHWIGTSAVRGVGLGNVIIGMAVVAAALDVESSLMLTFGGVIHGLLVYWTLDVLVRSSQWRQRPTVVREARTGGSPNGLRWP